MGESRYQVVMPKLGLIMTEARLVEWHVAEGAWVEKGAPLFTLETEKSTLDIEAPASGYVHLLVAAGETVPVQTVIAVIGEATSQRINEATSQRISEATSQRINEATGRQGDKIGGGLRATPKARRLAREQGIALVGLSGTGLRGMIVAADVARATPAPVKATPVARQLAAAEGVDLSGIAGTGPRGQITRADVERALAERRATPPPPAPPSASPTITPLPRLPGLRGVIAERLAAAWRDRPQATLFAEADATALVSARAQLAAEGVRVSYNAFFVLAAARALQDFPALQAQWTAEGLIHPPEINIGVAVDTDRGLLVPVVRQADRRSLLAVEQELQALAQRARAGQSLPDELTGGTFTITNLGGYGIDSFMAVINPPETAILAIGRIAPQAVVINGQVAVRERVTLSLSFDHRLVDGGPAARCLQRLIQLVERPWGLVVRE